MKQRKSVVGANLLDIPYDCFNEIFQFFVDQESAQNVLFSCKFFVESEWKFYDGFRFVVYTLRQAKEQPSKKKFPLVRKVKILDYLCPSERLAKNLEMFPNLKYLDIRWSKFVNDSCVASLRVEELNIATCEGITGSCFENTPLSESLKKLHVNKSNVDSLKQESLHGLTLDCLKVCEMWSIDSELDGIYLNFEFLTSFGKVSEVNLGMSGLTTKWDSSSNRYIPTAFSSSQKSFFKDVRVLILGCRFEVLSDNVLQHFVSLQELNLNLRNGTTGSFTASIKGFEKMKKLEVLELRGHRKVSPDIIDILPPLQKLNAENTNEQFVWKALSVPDVLIKVCLCGFHRFDPERKYVIYRKLSSITNIIQITCKFCDLDFKENGLLENGGKSNEIVLNCCRKKVFHVCDKFHNCTSFRNFDDDFEDSLDFSEIKACSLCGSVCLDCFPTQLDKGKRCLCPYGQASCGICSKKSYVVCDLCGKKSCGQCYDICEKCKRNYCLVNCGHQQMCSWCDDNDYCHNRFAFAFRKPKLCRDCESPNECSVCGEGACDQCSTTCSLCKRKCCSGNRTGDYWDIMDSPCFYSCDYCEKSGCRNCLGEKSDYCSDCFGSCCKSCEEFIRCFSCDEQYCSDCIPNGVETFCKVKISHFVCDHCSKQRDFKKPDYCGTSCKNCSSLLTCSTNCLSCNDNYDKRVFKKCQNCEKSMCSVCCHQCWKCKKTLCSTCVKIFSDPGLMCTNRASNSNTEFSRFSCIDCIRLCNKCGTKTCVCGGYTCKFRSRKCRKCHINFCVKHLANCSCCKTNKKLCEGCCKGRRCKNGVFTCKSCLSPSFDLETTCWMHEMRDHRKTFVCLCEKCTLERKCQDCGTDSKLCEECFRTKKTLAVDVCTCGQSLTMPITQRCVKCLAKEGILECVNCLKRYCRKCKPKTEVNCRRGGNNGNWRCDDCLDKCKECGTVKCTMMRTMDTIHYFCSSEKELCWKCESRKEFKKKWEVVYPS